MHIKLKVPLPEGNKGETVEVSDERGSLLVEKGYAVESDAPEEDDRPAGNATTEEWRAYRLAHGYTADELVDEDGEPKGRDDLRELADR